MKKLKRLVIVLLAVAVLSVPLRLYCCYPLKGLNLITANSGKYCSDIKISAFSLRQHYILTRDDYRIYFSVKENEGSYYFVLRKDNEYYIAHGTGDTKINITDIIKCFFEPQSLDLCGNLIVIYDSNGTLYNADFTNKH